MSTPVERLKSVAAEFKGLNEDATKYKRSISLSVLSRYIEIIENTMSDLEVVDDNVKKELAEVLNAINKYMPASIIDDDEKYVGVRDELNRVAVKYKVMLGDILPSIRDDPKVSISNSAPLASGRSISGQQELGDYLKNIIDDMKKQTVGDRDYRTRFTCAVGSPKLTALENIQSHIDIGKNPNISNEELKELKSLIKSVCAYKRNWDLREPHSLKQFNTLLKNEDIAARPLSTGDIQKLATGKHEALTPVAEPNPLTPR